MRDVSFEVGRGEVVALVGESGSGKTLSALAILSLVPPPGRAKSGRIRFDGVDVLSLAEPALRELRGGRIGFVFQEPGAALDPVLSIGDQLVETIRAHRSLASSAARRRAEELLERVAVPDPHRRLDAYPHQLSGGQRQRVTIALALAGDPDLLVADEPTTALDVSLQAEMMELFERLRRDSGLAILLVTHDLGVVAESCDRVIVVYAGQVVESAPTAELFSAPLHPYTRALLGSMPRLGRRVERGALPTIQGQVPSPARLPRGCTFHPRCAERLYTCSTIEPQWAPVAGDRGARCVLVNSPSEPRAHDSAA